MRQGLIVLLIAVATPAAADLRVLATVPEWGALVQEIGGDKVTLSIATTARQDPHRIDARPSLIARARRADLVVANGAELEIGWLPLVLRESGNPAIQPGRPGYFEAAAGLPMLEIPLRADRADGDVHPGGNPHIVGDPRLIMGIGSALAERMAALDPGQAEGYRLRWKHFAERWQQALVRWHAEAAPLRGQPVLVQHKAFPYLTNWLGLKEIGALEPKPGMEPTSAHLVALLEQQRSSPARMVLRAAYQPEGPSRWFADKTGIPAVMLPFTVGGSAGADDLFGLYEDTVVRLNQALSDSR